jgi:hypothetical protein
MRPEERSPSGVSKAVSARLDVSGLSRAGPRSTPETRAVWEDVFSRPTRNEKHGARMHRTPVSRRRKKSPAEARARRASRGLQRRSLRAPRIPRTSRTRLRPSRARSRAHPWPGALGSSYRLRSRHGSEGGAGRHGSVCARGSRATPSSRHTAVTGRAADPAGQRKWNEQEWAAGQPSPGRLQRAGQARQSTRTLPPSV